MSIKSRKGMRCLTLALCALVACGFAGAEGYPKADAYVNGGPHWEERELAGSATNWDLVAGYDFLVWDFADLYAGPRLGWYTETVATAALDWGVHGKPSLGGQVYFLIPSPLTSSLALSCGAAGDFLFNFDAAHSDPSERVYLFTEVFLGIRTYIQRKVHIEGRIDAGVFPFFDPTPSFVKAGLQLGYDF